MKKLLILTAALLTGGLALPAAAAQPHRGSSSTSAQIFVSGHLRCGTPIYSKRVKNGKHIHNQRLSGYELQKYLNHQRRIAAQREQERRYSRSRYQHSRSSNSRYQTSRR